MDNRATRSMGVHVDKNAARLGSEDGEGFNKHAYRTTADVSAQPCCISMRKAFVVQLRLFPVDGAWTELYVPARARRIAKAAVGGGRRAK